MGKENSVPELSVLLVNHNDKKHLGRCLSTLLESIQGIPNEVVIIDNNSSDGSQEFIRESFPGAKLVCNTENIGFSRANNLAIRGSRGKFVLLLNTDTELPPGALPLLLEELRSDPEVGGVGPALIGPGNVHQVSFGGRVGFFSQIVQKFFLNPYFRCRLRFSPRKREVRWLSAACVLFRREALEEAGLFDEKFFLYFEDIDLCFRLWRKGWKLVHFPLAEVFHEGGASTAAVRIASRFEYRRSQLYFYQKHNSRLSLHLLRLYLRLNFCVLYLAGMIKREEDLASQIRLRSRFFRLLKGKRTK